jgi:carbonic anhydrase
MDLIYRFDPFLPLAGRKVDTSDEAARLLREGNDLFVTIAGRVREHFQGTEDHHGEPLVVPLDPMTFGIPMVNGSAVAQSPFALVLGCSDARAPVELIFQQTCNDVFVVRVAGNVLGVECLGSIDYAARNLGNSLKLVVVLGHTNCGAVTAAVDMYLDPHDYPDLDLTHSLRSLIDRIMIAVRGSAKALERAGGPTVVHSPGYRAALLEISLYLNAALTSFDLRRELQASGDRAGIDVVYGVFDIITQRVRAMPDGVGTPGEHSSFGTAPLQVQDFERLSADLVRSVVSRGILYRSPAN